MLAIVSLASIRWPFSNNVSISANSSSSKWRLKTFSTAPCVSFSMIFSSLTSPTDSSSILPAVEATNADRSLTRGAP